jgi:hypothetical protein
MAKIENMKGIITFVTAVQKLPGEKGTPIQYICFEVAGYTDQFGDKKGRDQQWLLQIIGQKKIDELKLLTKYQGCKASVTFYSESFCVESKEPGQNPIYFTNHSLASYTIIP